jgi:hypothetical protein
MYKRLKRDEEKDENGSSTTILQSCNELSQLHSLRRAHF